MTRASCNWCVGENLRAWQKPSPIPRSLVTFPHASAGTSGWSVSFRNIIQMKNTSTKKRRENKLVFISISFFQFTMKYILGIRICACSDNLIGHRHSNNQKWYDAHLGDNFLISQIFRKHLREIFCSNSAFIIPLNDFKVYSEVYYQAVFF